MNNIIFVPICENCGHEFVNLDLDRNFNLQCPKCGSNIAHVLFPHYDYLVNAELNNVGIHFCYNKNELYGE